MPAFTISEYQSGRVVFAPKKGTQDPIHQLEHYIQDYKKISRVENQFIVRHIDGSDTDTAGHPVSKDISPLLFQFDLEQSPGKVILSMDISENTPGTRLGINQLEAYAEKLDIHERHLLSWVHIEPKIELTGTKSHETHLAYDKEKLDYKNAFMKKDLRNARLKSLLGLAAIIVPIAAAVLVGALPAAAWFLVTAIIVAMVAASIGFFILNDGVADWVSLTEPNEVVMFEKYNKHFGRLCTKVEPLYAPEALCAPKIEQSDMDLQKIPTEANPCMEEREPSKSMSCDV